MTQPTLDGMPPLPSSKRRRLPSTRTTWALLSVARPPVCTRCARESYDAGVWGHVATAAYKRTQAGDATFWCPTHAEEQRRADGLRELPQPKK